MMIWLYIAFLFQLRIRSKSVMSSWNPYPKMLDPWLIILSWWVFYFGPNKYQTGLFYLSQGPMRVDTPSHNHSSHEEACVLQVLTWNPCSFKSVVHKHDVNPIAFDCPILCWVAFCILLHRQSCVRTRLPADRTRCCIAWAVIWGWGTVGELCLNFSYLNCNHCSIELHLTSQIPMS